MKTVNNNNRYYCHRRVGKEVNLNAQKRTIYIPFDATLEDKYAKRLHQVYHYNVQFQIV